DNTGGNVAGSGFLVNSEFKNAATNGCWFWFDVMIECCYFHNNTGDAIKKVSSQNQLFQIVGSIFASNGRGVVGVAGINYTTLERNSFYSQTTDAVNLTPTGTANAGTLFSIASNIFYGNGGWGMNFNSNLNNQYVLYNRCNAYGSNTSGNHDT